MGGGLGVLCSCPCLHAADHQEGFVPFRSTGGNVVCLIIALDYRYSPHEAEQLNCSKDAEVFYRIVDRTDDQVQREVKRVLDHDVKDANFPGRDVFLKLLIESARKCRPGDWFVFYYAGHGDNVPDRTGEEASGFDQAFVLPNKRTLELDDASMLIDDEFALHLDEHVPAGVRILVLCDCCHAGTICDIDTFKYNHDIYSISATQDDEEAEEKGGLLGSQGGTFTNSLKDAMAELSMQYQDDEFSIEQVAEKAKKRVAGRTREQHCTFQWSGPDPSTVAWPLCGKDNATLFR